MAYSTPTVDEFKAHFTRDFPYGTTQQYVMDADITKAIAEAAFNINEAMWDTEAQYKLAYLYLMAHYLVMDLRASSQGLAGKYSFLEQSKSAGSVAQSFGIPQQVLDNPVLSMLAKTNYGAKYLSMALPQMVGQVHAVCGRTLP